jgi:hypothetical protein
VKVGSGRCSAGAAAAAERVSMEPRDMLTVFGLLVLYDHEAKEAVR